MEIRVSCIAELGWCWEKARATAQGEIGNFETEEMAEGSIIHKLLGFDQNIEVKKQFGKYTIIGHIDRLENGVVCELKTWRGRYPLRYLTVCAEKQANIYAYLANAMIYRVIVIDTNMAAKNGYNVSSAVYARQNTVNVFEAERDIALMIGLLEGFIEPKPGATWKCRACPHRRCRFRVG